MNVVYCNIDGSLISGGLAAMWFKFRVHYKLGQGSFSANIHNPCLPCPGCSQRNVNEVHFKCRAWGPRQCDTLSAVFGETDGRSGEGEGSIRFSRVICSTQASQQGVAVSQLTRWRLTLVIKHRCLSALTWAGEDDETRGGTDERAEETTRWCSQSP